MDAPCRRQVDTSSYRVGQVAGLTQDRLVRKSAQPRDYATAWGLPYSAVERNMQIGSLRQAISLVYIGSRTVNRAPPSGA